MIRYRYFRYNEHISRPRGNNNTWCLFWSRELFHRSVFFPRDQVGRGGGGEVFYFVCVCCRCTGFLWNFCILGHVPREGFLSKNSDVNALHICSSPQTLGIIVYNTMIAVSMFILFALMYSISRWSFTVWFLGLTHLRWLLSMNVININHEHMVKKQCHNFLS